jgi:hypothetical protein
MVEPFSFAVGALGLIDVVLRCSIQVSTIAARIANASAQVRRLSCTISELRDILTQIKNLASSFDVNLEGSDVHNYTFSSMQNTLRSCESDLRSLENLLSVPNKAPDGSLNRLGKRIKSVVNEDEIKAISQRIEGHKSSLQLVLAVAGRCVLVLLTGHTRIAYCIPC